VYEYLEGCVVQRTAARLVLDVNGHGYDISVPVGADFRGREGERTRVYTHFVVREDAHRLYGFPDERLRALFRLLLDVRGVGPVLALTILSGLSEEDLLTAIASGDKKPLVRIRGVGKKTAEQILLDLRDRAPKPAAKAGSAELRPVARASAREERLVDAVRALASIGYAEPEARRAVERAAEKLPTDDLEALVRAALQE
jgi:Holliday junction DNA helicase RuvA